MQTNFANNCSKTCSAKNITRRKFLQTAILGVAGIFVSESLSKRVVVTYKDCLIINGWVVPEDMLGASKKG